MYIPCDWDKSTRKIMEPKKISEIFVQKKKIASMGYKPKDTIPIPYEGKECKSLIYGIPIPIFTEMLQKCYRRVFIRIFLFFITPKPFWHIFYNFTCL